MMLRKLSDTSYAAVEIVYYVITIFVAGALYSLLFIVIALPLFRDFIPASDTKTLIMMFMYGLPGIILVVGALALIIRGVQKNREAGW